MVEKTRPSVSQYNRVYPTAYELYVFFIDGERNRKNSGLYGNRTHNPAITGAVLYQVAGFLFRNCSSCELNCDDLSHLYD